MLVYHGTSLARWKRIRKTGLVSRSAGAGSNWKHSVESSERNVYLTDAYALYFALQSIKQVGDRFDDAVVIEIDTDRLNQDALMADEDALEQVGKRAGDSLPEGMSMHDRTVYYRDHAHFFAEKGLGFGWSMDTLGTAAYGQRVPPSAFTRVAVVDIKKQRELSWQFMDAQISVQNYRFVGAKYRILTARLFGDEPRAEDLAGLGACGYELLPTTSRDGIRIVELNRRA